MPIEARLQLLTRPDCHLCEEAALMLQRLGAVFDTINVEVDAALEQRYGESVPVVLFGESEVCRAPITEGSLLDALKRTGLTIGAGRSG